MVTSGGRSRFARVVSSIADYTRQSYTPRELVIVADEMSDQDFAQLRSHCRSLRRTDIRLVRPTRKRCLGALRNLTVDHARGTIVCQWDDDDLHHPERLEAQAMALQLAGAGAVFLKDVMHLLEAYRAMFWVEWDWPGIHCHTATLMAFKHHMPRYPEVGNQSRRTEDLNVFLQLRRNDHVSLIYKLPYLYTYVFHGSNTLALNHHVAALRFSVPGRTLARHKKQLCAQMERVTFDRTGVRLLSPSGVVATLE